MKKFFVILLSCVSMAACTKQDITPTVDPEKDLDLVVGTTSGISGQPTPGWIVPIGAFQGVNPTPRNILSSQMLYGMNFRLTGYDGVVDSIYWKIGSINATSWSGKAVASDELAIILNQQIMQTEYGRAVYIFVKIKNPIVGSGVFKIKAVSLNTAKGTVVPQNKNTELSFAF